MPTGIYVRNKKGRENMRRAAYKRWAAAAAAAAARDALKLKSCFSPAPDEFVAGINRIM